MGKIICGQLPLGLHQMIRYDGNNLRLDGVMHRPALSKALRVSTG